jgi:thiol-disulfide isomerase/thioredoxin
MRKFLWLGGGVAVTVAVVVGLSQTEATNDAPSTSDARYSLADARKKLAGAPAPLAALHAQGNRLLGGGEDAVRDRLAALKGYPVVVNKWASWCGPCRAEFPFFQNVAVERGKEIAFLGLNSGDNRGDAKEFLADSPVPYPSYEDPNGKGATDIGAAAAYPVAVFYDATGERAYVHQGGYASEADLVADIEKYAVAR